MIRKILTEEQIKTISKNKNVRRCGAKSVRYNKSFKLTALKKYHQEGQSAVGIFKEAGFDLDIIGIRKPNKLMNQWNTAFGEKNKPIQTENPRIKIKRVESRRKMNDLEARIAYLQAENDFLARLRAGKRK
jgi:transposase